MQTPLEIEILLWYATHTQDYPDCTMAAIEEALTKFCRLGLLFKNPETDQDNPVYLADHSAMAVYLDALCQVPLPKKTWVVNSNV